MFDISLFHMICCETLSCTMGGILKLPKSAERETSAQQVAGLITQFSV
jgi:hypothetical protein